MHNTTPQSEGLAHAVFLGRLGEQPATSPEVRLGQAAFLTLRLVDLLGPQIEPPHPDAFEYQWRATERYASELAGEGPEANHLIGIVSVAREAHRRRDVRLLAPGLLAYAQHLEDEAHYEEALDALDALLRVVDGKLPSADGIAARLRVARVNRKMARFDEAEAAYAEAGTLAGAAGDEYSVLLSRIGRANVLWGRGNLSNAERAYRAILSEPGLSKHRDAEARSEHGLATVLDKRGQPAEAAVHLWRAYKLYEDSQSRLNALADLGIAFVRLGDVASAESALGEVVKRSRNRDAVMNAKIELMHCASYRRDRFGFERRRAECEADAETMAPNMLADFYFKAGVGQARFGQVRKGEGLIAKALNVAQAHGLHEFVFRFERIKTGLRECEQELQAPVLEPAEHPMDDQALREVATSVAALGG